MRDSHLVLKKLFNGRTMGDLAGLFCYFSPICFSYFSDRPVSERAIKRSNKLPHTVASHRWAGAVSQSEYHIARFARFKKQSGKSTASRLSCEEHTLHSHVPPPVVSRRSSPSVVPHPPPHSHRMPPDLNLQNLCNE